MQVLDGKEGGLAANLIEGEDIEIAHMLIMNSNVFIWNFEYF
jgi:hypothetical protein